MTTLSLAIGDPIATVLGPSNGEIKALMSQGTVSKLVHLNQTVVNVSLEGW